MSAAARQRPVSRLSVRDELAQVVRVGTAIALGVWLYLASTLGDASGARSHLLPYQALIQGRPATEQRVFRELQEGLLEAESVRAATGSWPRPDALAAAGIPPFAPDPTAGATSCQWQQIRDGTRAHYTGRPDHPGAPAWLVLIQEPEAGAPPDPAPEDEEHHRLADGTMLHVSIWSRADGRAGTPAQIRLPQAEGWTQLYAVAPGGGRGSATPP